MAFTNLRRWLLLSGQVASVQVLLQGVNAATGLMLVRSMEKQEYAWFTVASSLMAALNVLGDAGLSTGLMSVGGRVFQKPETYSRLLREALAIARWMVFFAVLVAIPLYGWLFANLYAPAWTSGCALLLAASVAWPSVANILLNVANRLHGRVGPLQAGELGAALVRLIGTLAVLALGLASLLSIMATVVAATWLHAVFVRFQTRVYLSPVPAAETFRAELWSFPRSLYANHVFFCVQGQAATWIIGWLANADSVADLGALSRLAVVFTAVSAPFYYLAVPSLARLQDMSALRRRFALALLAAAGLSSLIVASGALFPEPYLWILGGNYLHLGAELPLALTSQGLVFVNNLAWSLLLTRSWVKRPWIVIPMTLAGYAAGAVLFDLAQVSGVLLFSAVSTLPTMLFGLYAVCIRFYRGASSSI